MNTVIGIILIVISLLNSYYASNFKRINYIFGLLAYLIMGFVALINHIYGSAIFYLSVFSIMQVLGYINWGKNQDNENNVVVRSFSNKNRIIMLVSCIVLSIVLATILNQIPMAQFTFLDAFSNIINLCGVVLMALRFNESWWLWLINNIIDLILWANVVNIGGDLSIFMLVSSIIYLLVNVYGIMKWNKKAKDSMQNILKVSTLKEIEKVSHIANIISLFCYVIVDKKFAIFVVGFCIVQTILNRLLDKQKRWLCIPYLLVSIAGCLIIKLSSLDWIIFVCLLLFSLIPLFKNVKHVRIVGFINIFAFIFYDFLIGLFNLGVLDIFILLIMTYGIYINDIKKEK